MSVCLSVCLSVSLSNTETVCLAKVIIAQIVTQCFSQRKWAFFNCENREKERETIYTHRLELEMLMIQKLLTCIHVDGE